LDIMAFCFVCGGFCGSGGALCPLGGGGAGGHPGIFKR